MVQSRSQPDVAKLEQRALSLEAEKHLEDARDAFDAALRLNPTSQTLAEGRARVAIALNEEGAFSHCARALAFHDSAPDRQLRMMITAAAALGPDASKLFEDFIRRNPDNPAAHEMLAQMRAEHGAGDAFADSYVEALRRFPANRHLLMSYWNTLTRAGRLDEALVSMDANRSLFAGDRAFALLEVNAANHAGCPDRAGALLDALDDRPDAQVARGQHRLQSGDPEQAARLLEAVVQAEPDNLTAWALLELAWRINGDRRHRWLAGQPGLCSAAELDLDPDQLERIAAALRAMHGDRSQPIGQSVRGGSQTPGQLFLRSNPEIVLLTNALVTAIRNYFAGLPAEDRSHPLLRYRNSGIAFGASWSIRLTAGGHHAAHFHPGGIVSSACYISLPAAVADTKEKPGWLEIGRPPPELGLDLSPMTTLEPKPGRLILFPSYMFHGTRPFDSGERLTVAFDLVPVPAA